MLGRRDCCNSKGVLLKRRHQSNGPRQAGDVVTVWTSERKQKLQKRHMSTNIKDTHAIFKEENANVIIGISKFAAWRPPNVSLNSQTPSNVCQCTYHQNSIMAVHAVHNYLTDISPYTKDVPASCLDCPQNEECWFGTCSHESCEFADVYTLPNEPHLTELPAKWNKWQDIEGRLVKHEETGSVANLNSYIESIAPKFFKHGFVKRMQSKS